MTNHITISWNTEREEETEVKTTQAFDALDRIEKLDMLKDAIYDLEQLYDSLLAETNQGENQ